MSIEYRTVTAGGAELQRGTFQDCQTARDHSNADPQRVPAYVEGRIVGNWTRCDFIQDPPPPVSPIGSSHREVMEERAEKNRAYAKALAEQKPDWNDTGHGSDGKDQA